MVSHDPLHWLDQLGAEWQGVLQVLLTSPQELVHVFAAGPELL